MFGFLKRNDKHKNTSDVTNNETAASLEKDSRFVMPIEGSIIPLSEVEDPVFSQKMMGDGFAIIPEVGSVSSPVDGEIINVFPTKHAIGIKSRDGDEILIHVGLETVHLKGDGFTCLVEEGAQVSRGQEILRFDLEFIRKNARSTVTPVIVIDSKDIVVEKFGHAVQGEGGILTIKKELVTE